jgi:hypothetical protein
LLIGTVRVDGKLRMKFYKLSEINLMKDSINQDVSKGILPDMYWHTSGIMDTPWGPAVLLEGAEINSSYAGQPIGVQQQRFIYREGWMLGTGQEAGISWVNSINMTGLSSNIPQSWLQSMPSGKDHIKIWFYNSHGLGMKEIDKSRSVTGRYYLSLTAPETGDRIHFKEDGNGFLSCGSYEYFYYGVMTEVNESREEEDWFYIRRVKIR